MTKQGTRLLTAIVIAAIAVTIPNIAKANENPVDAAFARMMAQPDDPEAAFAYARAAAEAGEPRAAIAALERVLRQNPRLDNIRLELSSLYMAAGSPDVAALYAKEALASPDIPKDVAERAKELLASAEKASSRSLLQVNVFTGFRWDSNATQATASGSVPIYSPSVGAAVSVTPSVKAQADGSWVTSAQLSHHYDLGLQREGAWETNFSVYDQRFFHINHAYDLDVVQFDTGPRIGAGDIGSVKTSIRPFFTTSYIAYGDLPYAALYGGGVSAQAQISPSTTVGLTGIGQFGNYYNTNFRPLTSQYTGPEWTIIADVAYAVTPSITLSGSGYYYWADAQQGYYSRQGPGASLSVSSEFLAWGHTVGTVARVGLRRLTYGAADPFIDPTQNRVDSILDAGLSLIVPISQRLRFLAQYSYYRDNSSYSIYSFNDNSVSVGLRLDF